MHRFSRAQSECEAIESSSGASRDSIFIIDKDIPEKARRPLFDWRDKSITKLDRDKIDHIDVKEPWTANVCFGGKDKDLLFITADHGCDPDPRWETTDHSREYVPILAYSPGHGAGLRLGVRETLADMGQTIAEKDMLDIHGREACPGTQSPPGNRDGFVSERAATANLRGLFCLRNAKKRRSFGSFSSHEQHRSARHAINSLTTRPCTSVRRKSRPA